MPSLKQITITELSNKIDVIEQKTDVIEQKVDEIITLMKTQPPPQQQVGQPQPPPQVIEHEGHEIHAQPAIKQSNQCKKCYTTNKVLIVALIAALTAIVFKIVNDSNDCTIEVDIVIELAAHACGNEMEENYLMYSLCRERYENETQQQYFSMANSAQYEVKTA